MKLILEHEEYSKRFEKLVASLINGNDVTNFSIDKPNRYVNMLFGDWNVTLHDDGTWDIA